MGKTERKIIGLVLVPSLIALILLSGTWFVSRSSHQTPEGSADAGQSEAVEKAGAETGQAGGKSGQTGAESEQKTAENGDTGDGKKIPPVPEQELMQQIAFTAGGPKEAQRSVPVQLDTSILGGEKGVMCWAVFLPAEMSGHPRIRFSAFKSVSMKALKDGEYYQGARLGPENSSAGDYAGDSGSGENTEHENTDRENTEHIYFSGDEISGLENGTAFSVTLEREDGSTYSDVLYVFSCTGTATMYLDTESGSMEAVDSDTTKQTKEKASFTVFLPSGRMDSEGECVVSGRGNSTWFMMKRPYNVNLTEKQSVLGMKTCKKLCLLANTFDHTNLLDRISSQLALELAMRDTPEGEFVNLYLNGKYNGLYFLSQRPRTGGSVEIDRLDDRIKSANGQKSGSAIPKRIALHKKGDKLYKWAYSWPEEPADNTGGYLLQQSYKYDGETSWFTTIHRKIRIMSPAYPTAGEVNYISDYMLEAERTVYSEDGTDPETGKKLTDYLDVPSWQDMFLLEEYFVEWDGERWSFYIIKDRQDPLLYCGPMWDFDHSAGTMLYGNYPETAVSTLMFRDSRDGWLHTLLKNDEFADGLYTRWRERFSPAIHRFLDERMEKEIAEIESAAYMNNIRRSNDDDFREKTAVLTDWLQRRVDFLDSYVGEGGGNIINAAEDTGKDTGEAAGKEGQSGENRYCRVLFKFPWGDLSHYVLPGETLGYLPLPEYGETQIPSQIKKREIIGWLDEDGNTIGADIVIDRDRTFTADIAKK